jgi:hypothetical protein
LSETSKLAVEAAFIPAGDACEEGVVVVVADVLCTFPSDVVEVCFGGDCCEASLGVCTDDTLEPALGAAASGFCSDGGDVAGFGAEGTGFAIGGIGGLGGGAFAKPLPYL